VGICLDDANEDFGGRLELVPNTSWNKQVPNIAWVLAENQVLSFKPKAGDLYVNRADTTLHRVSPLERDDTVRTMVVFSYSTEADKGKEPQFETMEALYPEDCSA
jgi:hypothetical protein